MDSVTIGGVTMSVEAARNLEAVCERSYLATQVAADVAACRANEAEWVGSVTGDVGEPEYAQGWLDYAEAIKAAADEAEAAAWDDFADSLHA